MKENVGPIAIIGVVVLLVGLLFVLFRTTFSGPAHNVSKDNAPDYAKKSGMVESGGNATNPQAALEAMKGGGGAPYGGQGAGRGAPYGGPGAPAPAVQ